MFRPLEKIGSFSTKLPKKTYTIIHPVEVIPSTTINHEIKPFIVSRVKENPNNLAYKYIVIYYETFAQLSKEANDFLISISEPSSCQNLVHRYHITHHSLNAAVALEYTAEMIFDTLQQYSKYELDSSVKKFIYDKTAKFGKAKIIMKAGSHYVETRQKSILEEYLSKNVTQLENNNRLWKTGEIVTIDLIQENKLRMLDEENGKTAIQNINTFNETEESKTFLEKNIKEIENCFLDEEDDVDFIKTQDIVYRLEINNLLAVRNDKTYILSEEFDYLNTPDIPSFPFLRMREETQLRAYQEQALSKMFVSGRARSGIIVLPCGAGKTLVGVGAFTRIKKRTIIFCPEKNVANQWHKTLRESTSLADKNIFNFRSDSIIKLLQGLPSIPKTFNQGQLNQMDDQQKKALAQQIKEDLKSFCVVITTYQMIAQPNQDSDKIGTALIRNFLGQMNWGLQILDEVQQAPADTFQEAFLRNTISHCKLGLTATLVREDEKIDNLYYNIGPKLYEVSWLHLTQLGYLAAVRCKEFRIPIHELYKKKIKDEKQFYKEMGLNEMKMKNSLKSYNSGNPYKLLLLQFLLEKHRKDKVLVFVNQIPICKVFAELTGSIYIDGSVKHDERHKFYKYFRNEKAVNVLFVSRVGDEGIDLPEANVGIIIDSHGKSRRQHAQRMGRIIRPKKNNEDKNVSYFYSLVNLKEKDIKEAINRQKYLAKQGYTYETKEITLEFLEELKKRYHEKNLKNIKKDHKYSSFLNEEDIHNYWDMITSRLDQSHIASANTNSLNQKQIHEVETEKRDVKYTPFITGTYIVKK